MNIMSHIFNIDILNPKPKSCPKCGSNHICTSQQQSGDLSAAHVSCMVCGYCSSHERTLRKAIKNWNDKERAK